MFSATSNRNGKPDPMKINRKPNYSKMTEYVEAMIAAGTYRSGDRLPTLRTLAEQFEINLDTARRGIWYLRDKGLLECRQGDGTYVNGFRRAEKSPHRIGLLVRLGPPKTAYAGYILRGLQEAAMGKAGATLEMRQEESFAADAETNLLESIRNFSRSCDALVLIGNYDDTLHALPSQVPVVGVEMHSNYGGILSTISMDPIRSAELAVEFFRERRVKEVKIIDSPTPLHNFRSEVFAARWAAHGKSTRFEVSRIHPEAFLPEDPAIGYFFTGGTTADESAKRLKAQTGKILCRDFHAIALDGKSRLVPGFEPMNVIMPDWLYAGDIALNEALRRIRTPGASSMRLYLDVKYIPYQQS